MAGFDGWSDPVIRRDCMMDAVREADWDSVEGYRSDVGPHVEYLESRYWGLTSWEQKTEMVHLLCDQPREKVEKMMWDFLTAPRNMMTLDSKESAWAILTDNRPQPDNVSGADISKQINEMLAERGLEICKEGDEGD